MKNVFLVFFALLFLISPFSQDELIQLPVYHKNLYLGFDNIKFLKSAQMVLDGEKQKIDYYVFYSERYSAHYLNSPVHSQYEGEPTDYVIQGMIVVDASGGCVYYKSEETVKGIDEQKRTVKIQWNDTNKTYSVHILDPQSIEEKQEETFELDTEELRLPIFSYLTSSLFIYNEYNEIVTSMRQVKAINPYKYKLQRKLKSVSAGGIRPDTTTWIAPDGNTWFYPVFPFVGKFSVGRDESGKVNFPEFEATFDK